MGRKISSMVSTLLGVAALAAIGSAFAQRPGATGVARADVLEIVRSAGHVGVKLRLPNGWKEPIYIGACDTPMRLSGVTAYLERFSHRMWKEVKPPNGAVLGDLPPTSLEIKPGAAVDLPFAFDPAFMALSARDTVRIVVLARTKGGAMGIGVTSPKLITKPFKVPGSR